MQKDDVKKILQVDGMLGVYKLSAIKAFHVANKKDWQSAAWAAKVVSKNKPGERGQTLALAEETGKSVDTIEDRAHAYWLFEDLCKLNGGASRKFVFLCRRAPFIYISHFRALYDLRNAYKLTDEQVLELLADILHGEGGISSRNLETHTRSKYGDSRDWTFYAQKALKELNKVQGEPTLPNTSEEIGYVFKVPFIDKEGNDIKEYTVVAYDKKNAEKTARQQLKQDHGEKTEKNAICDEINEIAKAITGSKNILNITSSWLGDNS